MPFWLSSDDLVMLCFYLFGLLIDMLTQDSHAYNKHVAVCHSDVSTSTLDECHTCAADTTALLNVQQQLLPSGPLFLNSFCCQAHSPVSRSFFTSLALYLSLAISLSISFHLPLLGFLTLVLLFSISDPLFLPFHLFLFF